jgi:hypothetical protein
MKRFLPATVLTLAAVGMLLGAASAQQPPANRREPPRVPPTPAALRDFDGSLFGVVESIHRQPGFTGVIMRLTRAEPGPGVPLVDASRLLRARVPVAVPLDDHSTPWTSGLREVFLRLTPGEGIWAEVGLTRERRILTARRLSPLNLAGQVVPPPVPAARSVLTPSPDSDVRGMAAELRTLRRDLARLQREVAELQAIAAELSQRGPR